MTKIKINWSCVVGKLPDTLGSHCVLSFSRYYKQLHDIEGTSKCDHLTADHELTWSTLIITTVRPWSAMVKQGNMVDHG